MHKRRSLLSPGVRLSVRPSVRPSVTLVHSIHIDIVKHRSNNSDTSFSYGQSYYSTLIGNLTYGIVPCLVTLIDLQTRRAVCQR